MKKFAVLLFVMIAAVTGGYAQKVGYVNTETILYSLQEYKDSVAVIESKGKILQDQIDNEIKSIGELYNFYQGTKYNIAPEERSQVENEIIARERAVKAKQQEYFGQDGVMKKLAGSALKSIKDKVQAAIDCVAKENGYVLVVDLAVLPGVVYKDVNYDLNGKVIEEIKHSGSILL